MKTFTTIREIVENAAIHHPDNRIFTIKEKVGKEVEYKNISYRQFFNEVKALGTVFLERKFERVAVIGKNSHPWAVCYYAAVCSGRISVPLDKGLPKEEIAECLRRSGAQIIFYDEDHTENMKELCIREDLKNIKFVYMGKSSKARDNFFAETLDDYLMVGNRYLEAEGSTLFEKIKVKSEDICSILFTSGTTSNSKAVLLSHGNITSNLNAINEHLEFYEHDVNIALLPLHHTFGNIVLLVLISKGACTVFGDGLKYIQQNIKEYKVTVFVAVPLLVEGIYEKVMKQIKKQGKYDKVKKGVILATALKTIGIDKRRKIFAEIHEQFGGDVRMIVSGASALNKEVARGYNLIGIELIQGYGLTETSPVVSAETPKKMRYGSVGVPLANLEVKIDSPESDGTGEIIVKGPSVMQGYYNDPEETAKVLKDGWFYTGDLGYFDKNGFLYIKGRKKNVIVLKNGKNIYPEEIEELINRIPYVTECIVYGVDKKDDLVVCTKLVYDKAALLQSHPELTFLAAATAEASNEGTILSEEDAEALKKSCVGRNRGG